MKSVQPNREQEKCQGVCLWVTILYWHQKKNCGFDSKTSLLEMYSKEIIKWGLKNVHYSIIFNKEEREET